MKKDQQKEGFINMEMLKYLKIPYRLHQYDILILPTALLKNRGLKRFKIE
jgi:hypothetical protein